MAATLEGVFTARRQNRTVPGVGPAPQDQVEIQTDSLNNALIVFASKENVEIIKGLLEKLDVEPAAFGGVLEVFTLAYADAQRVATMLQSLVQQGMYRPGAPATSGAARSPREALAITVDPRSNTLLISASPENLLVVKEVIKRVDTRDWAATGNVRVYELKKARASSLATVLEQFFRAKRQGEAVAINAPERSVPVAVIPDDRVNVLLVTGTKESFDVMDRLVAQLDGEDVFTRMNFRVFPLKKATATKLQPTLQQIVANRPARVRGEPLDPITIVADSWVNALLVGASVEDLTTVASLIERLDTDQAELGISVHVFPLAKADARRVAQTIQALFREGAPGTTLPVTVNADERMNAIVVSAGEADARRIGELVKKLDTDQVARVSEIKVFPLNYARAESLSTILNTALNTKPTPLTEQSPNTQSLLQFITRTEEGKELVTAALKEAVLITPDARMNSLIVSGPLDYMGLIEQIITRLDNSSPQQAKIKVFTLVNADARQMAELLVQLFRMQQAAGTPANQRSVQYTLVRPREDETAQPGEEEELASATLGTAEQNALTVTVDPRTNSLLVGGTQHYVDLVSQIIESLDSSTADERKTEVYRLRNSQAQEIATSVRNFLDQERQRMTQILGTEAVGTAQRLLEREVAIVAEPVSNNLLISANPRYFDQIKKLITQLDQPQPQVLIQVLLAEVTLGSQLDLGVEWTYTGSSGNNKFRTGTDFGVLDQVSKSGGFSTAVTGSDYTFLLRALENDGRLEVLSRPQILTADNKPASINIGQRIPLITDSRVTERGDTINSFRYEDVGVNLSVTPRISSDGFVKMEIGTTNSAVSSSTVEINASATVPIINQRRATTTVSVQSGQTVIIGGLIATLDDTRIKKMPLLGDIPVLGLLFQSRTKVTDRKELLILLTPQVVKNLPEEEGVEAQAFTREQLDQSTLRTGIKRDVLQKRVLDPLFDTNALPAVPPGQPVPAPGQPTTRPPGPPM
jgi:type II secretory pathway component GspD/PulD (secretin)